MKRPNPSWDWPIGKKCDWLSYRKYLRQILPPLGNQFVYILKMSSLASDWFEWFNKASKMSWWLTNIYLRDSYVSGFGVPCSYFGRIASGSLARKKDCDSEPLNGSNPQERFSHSNKKPRAQTEPCLYSLRKPTHLSGDFFILIPSTHRLIQSMLLLSLGRTDGTVRYWNGSIVSPPFADLG